ncbi:MAG: hypothetical protein KDA87_10450, partial [Planctomycetales bacterium]|nr:hypothetical protein [Planctomycetales bacterium]
LNVLATDQRRVARRCVRFEFSKYSQQIHRIQLSVRPSTGSGGFVGQCRVQAKDRQFDEVDVQVPDDNPESVLRRVIRRAGRTVSLRLGNRTFGNGAY